MTTDERLLENFEDDPDCGVDAASDKGYWLEETDKATSDHLISWRKDADLSPELLSQLAPIPLEEYLLIEKGERTMTNGDAWRIDAAIIHYLVSRETRFQRSWKRGWLAWCRYKLRIIWESEIWGPVILIGFIIFHFIFVKPYLSETGYIIGFFLGSALSVGLPVCLAVWLVRYIVKELKE